MTDNNENDIEVDMVKKKIKFNLDPLEWAIVMLGLSCLAYLTGWMV